MRKATACVLALLMALGLLAGCGKTDAPEAERESADTEQRESRRREEEPNDSLNFAVNGYVLARDGEYEYEYDDKGLCVSARSPEGEALVFTYDCNADGRPVARYRDDGTGKRLFERYEYDSLGRLQRLRVFDGDGAESTVWEYDKNGRAVSGRGLPVTVPYAPGFPFNEADQITWDREGRLLSISFPVYYDLDQLALSNLGRVGSVEDIAQYREQLLEAAAEHGVKENADGLYLCMRFTEEYQYDGSGRVTKITFREEFCPLYEFTVAFLWCTRVRTTELKLSYRKDSFTVSYSFSCTCDGEPEGEPIHADWCHEIRTNADGLPVEAGGLSTDVYAALDCTVGTAELGLFGVGWREGMTNYYGELHGGFAGLDQRQNSYMSLIGAGYFQSLRIIGTKENGDTVEYTLWPDGFGRQLCQKFTNGLYTMPVSGEIDFQASYAYVMTEDRDEFVYTRFPGA